MLLKICLTLLPGSILVGGSAQYVNDEFRLGNSKFLTVLSLLGAICIIIPMIIGIGAVFYGIWTM